MNSTGIKLALSAYYYYYGYYYPAPVLGGLMRL
jgi:hypothetical protein